MAQAPRIGGGCGACGSRVVTESLRTSLCQKMVVNGVHTFLNAPNAIGHARPAIRDEFPQICLHEPFVTDEQGGEDADGRSEDGDDFHVHDFRTI